jgi:putative FmdB family regulatory protein
MPIYEYLCQECGSAFEKLRKAREADEGVECPDCDSGNVKRQLSSFAQAGGCAAPAGSRFR